METNFAPKTIITGHANADFDCLGAMVAAKKLYPDAALIFPGSKERAVEEFFMQGMALIFDFCLPKEVDFSNVSTLVLVDTRQKSRLSHVDEAFKNPSLVVHAFDHHPSNPDDLKCDFENVQSIGATVSLITNILIEKNIEVTRDEATIMGLGIYEDTGFLSYPCTTEADFVAAGWLRRHGMDLNTISSMIQQTMTPEQIALLHALLESATVHEINGIPVIIADAAPENFVHDFSIIAQEVMKTTQAKVLFALAIMVDKIQIIARSKVPEVDVGVICSSLGGGGHGGAASASVKSKTITEVKDALFGLLYSYVNPEVNVADIMSSPVHFVTEEDTIAEAEEIMLRYSLKSMPVVNPSTQTCVGIIDHQLAARAIVHGLGSQIVADYMNRTIKTLDSASSLYSVTEVVIDEEQALVPVLQDSKIVGVVSRTDILKKLLSDPARIPENLTSEAEREHNISSQLRTQLPGHYYDLLKSIGELGDELSVNVYAVGGFVRDILLKLDNFDLDVVVEGDGILFARELAKKLNGRTREHQSFKTATVFFNLNEKEAYVDVATARLEYYKHPAAMPTIELSSIKMDLYRRDFTVNALALHLNGNKFGFIVDFFGSQRDIKDHTIRVLHALSFVEDPTRILRAVRFEQRFGFSLATHTEHLVKNAIQLQVIEKLSGSRILNELELISSESSPTICFARLNKLGVLVAIHPALKFIPAKEVICKSMEKVLAWYELSCAQGLRPQNWICFLLCLCLNGKYLDVSSLLERLAFSEKHRKDFLQMREDLLAAGKNIKKWGAEAKKTNPSDIYQLLKPLSKEAVLFLMSTLTAEAERMIMVQYLTQLKDVKVDISGDDLRALGGKPGPKFTEILQKVLNAKLNGQAVTRTAQLNLARELLENSF